jgi:twitching motility protein PilT
LSKNGFPKLKQQQIYTKKILRTKKGDKMSLITQIAKIAVDHNASDIHLKDGSPPILRINGELHPLDLPNLSSKDIESIINTVLPNHAKIMFAETNEADFSVDLEDIGRFRVNMFVGKGKPTVAMRHVKSDIPTFKTLNLPEEINRIATLRRGIVLIAGTTGSGKSSTIAAILNQINKTRYSRIITIEDPVEYNFHDDKSIITQREVGIDTNTFHSALKALMRQDPDIIFIGEMRDPVSINAALLAAETGHLVFSTIHSATADAAISRMMDVFPTNEQDSVRLSIAATLNTIVCQRLVPANLPVGVVPAVEVMINSPIVKKNIKLNNLSNLSTAITTGRKDGMLAFDQSIYQLIKKGWISETEGMKYASSPESLKMNLQGIFLDNQNRIMG